jgi:hypothetical protein
MAKQVRDVPMYRRVFFDRTLLAGLIFLSLGYILNGTWLGAFAMSAALIIGTVWSYRAATTSPKMWFRLLSLLLLVLIGAMLAMVIATTWGLY